MKNAKIESHFGDQPDVGREPASRLQKIYEQVPGHETILEAVQMLME